MTRFILPAIVASACLPAVVPVVPVDPAEVMTERGLYMILLNPGELVSGEDVTLGLYVMSDGENVEGATVTVTPFMPDMGHGISDEVSVTEMGGGMYAASFAYSMGGYWELTIEIDAEAGADAAVLAYEID